MLLNMCMMIFSGLRPKNHGKGFKNLMPQKGGTSGQHQGCAKKICWAGRVVEIFLAGIYLALMWTGCGAYICIRDFKSKPCMK